MNRKILMTLLVLAPLASFCQEKKEYTINSIQHYDSAGNVFATKSTYDHIPTTEDSLKFFKDSEISIRQMIDSVHKAHEKETNEIPTRLKKHSKKSIKKKNESFHEWKKKP